ncbi:MAG: quercetin dioxygenase-like cupin family protein [Cryomorphaceae bacterium]|jgi:quercetin dioxygenase-like cupin family protein
MKEPIPKKSKILGNGGVNIATLIDYKEGSITRHEIQKQPNGSVILFAFAEGQSLSEHKAPFDVLLQIIEGEAEITVAGKPHIVKSGEMILIPAHELHAVKAHKRHKMILTKIKP